MFTKWKKTSINQINVIAILFAGIFAFVAAFVVIFNEYIEFEKEIAKIEIDYTQNQKRRAVEQTSRLYRLIDYRYEDLQGQEDFMLRATLAKEIGILLDNLEAGSYIFVYDEQGRVVYESRYTNHSTTVIADFIKTGSNGGGFLSFTNINKDQEVSNLAYIRDFKKSNWILGSGVNVNEIESVLTQKKEEYKNKITGFILKISTLTLFLYMASILKYRYITEKITKEMKFINESFKDASSNYTFIDRSKIKFEEFREITSQANFMISIIKEKNVALENLNKNLEVIVEQKTNELQKSVNYGKKLLADQDKFLKNAIHEINTPLSIMLMNIDLFNLKYNKNKYLIKMEAAVKVLQNIYGDLSFIVKKDKINNSVEMINFTKFLTERIDYFNDVAIGNRLSIKSEIEDEIFILFNEQELQRVCDNNLSNAIKYSFINEVIHVRLYTSESCTVFEVESKGEPIESTNSLFDRYYREDIARGGFGLGLNIVKEICVKNSVKIDVYSDENKTVFKYFFECSRRVS